MMRLFRSEKYGSFASLEWFGHNSKEILKEEMKVLINRKLEVVTS